MTEGKPAPGIPSREQPGQRIGRYTLLEPIGEGGFGIVWMAEQTEPVRRRVALKILKLGMDTREVVTRFEAERQALAMMDHPNIAKVLDGGATEQGRPFFVMELVSGTPITACCDARRLNTRERIELFILVCEAVQHAHQKGVIHRDLKPGNILVGEQDGRLVPKVIDFGVAKALEEPLTDKTLFTRYHQFLGTPAYMSPEQAGLGGLDVDTRSDIYSLGVLLYELLTGRAPFSYETVPRGSTDQFFSMVREREPAKLSTTLGTLKSNEFASVAARRSTTPEKLHRYLRGEIDWVVLKSLEKDRNRRYGTVREMIIDLEHFLAGEAVRARRITGVERAWRWCRRKPALAGALTVTLFAISTAVGFGIRAKNSERVRIKERQRNVVATALLTAWSGDIDGTEQCIREAELTGVSLAELRMLRGVIATHQGNYQVAVRELEHARKLSPKAVAICSMLMKAYLLSGRWDLAQPLFDSLPHLTPETPEDFLFMGSLYALVDPPRALPSLNEAERRRPTGIARLYRSSVYAKLALDQADLKYVEAAINDIQAAKAALPENPELIATSLNTHLVAVGVYEEYRAIDKHRAAWKQVQLDAARLESFPGNPAAALARAMYLKFAGEDWTPIEKLSSEAGEGRSRMLEQLEVISLYRRGQFQAGVDLIRTTTELPEPGRDYMRGYILAELPDGPQVAGHYVSRLLQGKLSTWDTMAIQTTLLLLGRRTEAMEACRKAKATASFPWRTEWYRALLDYNCGLVEADALVKLAGDSRFNQCEAHFFIALTALSEGDRTLAEHHFREAVATHVFHYFEYDWSHAFLARMDSDPRWPRWISRGAR